MNKSTLARALTAFIVTVIAIPLTTQAIFRSIDDEGKWIFGLQDIRPLVRLHYSTQWRQQRRLYSRAIEIYRDLLRQGVPGILRPDINDLESIMVYLDQDKFNAYLEDLDLHGAAEPLVYQEIQLLPFKEQERLFGHAASGRCHPSLKWSYLSGFYDLCLRLVATQESRERAQPGTVDIRKGIRGLYFNETAPQQSIKLRLQMMEQARTRSRREDSPKAHPLWPTFDFPGERMRYAH